MANQFSYPSTEKDAKKVLLDRKLALEDMRAGLGQQNALMDEQWKNAVAARRLLEPHTTEAERRGLVAWKIATGEVMASLNITERARAIVPKAYWARPSPQTTEPEEANRRHK